MTRRVDMGAKKKRPGLVCECGHVFTREELYKACDEDDLARAEELQSLDPTAPAVAVVTMFQNVMKYMQESSMADDDESKVEIEDDRINIVVKTPTGKFHLLMEKMDKED